MTTARAHTNIALIKYWGKLDEALIIPQNSSLSLTLDHFYTDTTVTFDENLTADSFYLDKKLVPRQRTSRTTHVLDIVRAQSGEKRFALVKSTNHVPTSAGLASSASGFAALAAAATKAAGLNLDGKSLSRIARRGSGSATRSIFGGFVEWHQGHSDETSYAEPIQEVIDWDICMLTVIVEKKRKKISSRAGMNSSVRTSPYYDSWLSSTGKDLTEIKQAISNKDLVQLGEISEQNAMKMHALTLSASPSFTYFNGDSIKIMDYVHSLRAKGIPCYYTMDAGPNVKIICRQSDVPRIISELSPDFSSDQLILAKPGSGVTYLD